MEHLHHRIDKKPKHPFVVMSNGGGVSEAERASQLTEQLQVPIAAEQVILGHTPMQVRSALPRPGASAACMLRCGCHPERHVLFTSTCMLQNM